MIKKTKNKNNKNNNSYRKDSSKINPKKNSVTP